jgi:hypothetical protein
VARRRAPPDRARRVDTAGSPQAARTAKAITVGEYADTWVARRTLKARTRSMNRDLLLLDIIPALGDIAVKHLTTDAVRAWFAFA